MSDEFRISLARVAKIMDSWLEDIYIVCSYWEEVTEYRGRFRIPKHKRFQILVSGLPLIFTFRFLGMTSMADFAIEGHVCEYMFVYLYFHNNIW